MHALPYAVARAARVALATSIVGDHLHGLEIAALVETASATLPLLTVRGVACTFVALVYAPTPSSARKVLSLAYRTPERIAWLEVFFLCMCVCYLHFPSSWSLAL